MRRRRSVTQSVALFASMRASNTMRRGVKQPLLVSCLTNTAIHRLAKEPEASHVRHCVRAD